MFKRGDVFWAELNPAVGSEQNGMRPVVILQNDVGNRHAPTVIVAPLTTNVYKGTHMPTHVVVKLDGSPQSVVLLEQIRTLDKSRLTNLVGRLDAQTMDKVGACIFRCLGLKGMR